MTPRIVSWKTNEPRVSPAESSATGASVVSINSIVSDTMTTGATGVQPAGLGAKLTNWPGSANLPTDESFVQHDVYFFKDGNITFLVRDSFVLCVQSTKKVQVDGTLYCVHRYFFSRDSDYYSTKFTQLDIRDHEPLSTIISLVDIERKDFEAFLSVLYPE
jgi:BTB/POZ domain-containing protein